MRNPGQIYQIQEGKNKGKFFVAHNKEQHKEILDKKKLVGTVCSDDLGTQIIKTNIMISVKNLQQTGYID